MVENLPNHLRSHRRRLAFSQGEVAFLLDVRHGAKVSRYERFRRQPSLPTALRLAAAYRVPVEDLFPGVAAEAEIAVADRAKLLHDRLAGSRQNALLAQKLAALRALIEPADAEVVSERLPPQ